MLGGTIIGQGTYGCAVVPPLLCKGRVRQDRKEKKKEKEKEKSVGKVTLMMDAETELSISKILRKVKLWKNYFILPELDSCTPVEANRSENWDTCRITEVYNSGELRQLTSDFGGRSFADLTGLNLKPGSFDYFRFLRHTLEACALLSLNSVVHYDLHRSNILVDSLGVPRLLDFGMSFDAKNIDDMVLKNRWKQYDPKYDSEPPEITVITGIRKGMNLDAAIKDCIYGKPIFKVYELFFQVPREKLVEQLRDFLKSSRSFEKHDWVLFFQTYWPAYDSFALGAVLLHLLQTQVTWPSFMESDEWISKGDKISFALKSMLNVNAAERYDCVEALYEIYPDSVVLKNSESWIAARKAQRQI